MNILTSVGIRYDDEMLYFDRDMTFYAALESQVSALTVEKVNTVIKKYFKSLDNWTVVNGGDFK